MKLRPYQNDAVQAVETEWREHKSTLAVMPTGTGKTVMFAELIRRAFPRRALILTHRAELIYQAAEKVRSMTGWRVDIEMGAERAEMACMFGGPRVVCSTIQTQASGGDGGGRMTRFDPRSFGTLIIDEGHHCFPYETKILTNFGRIKIGEIVENKNKLLVCSVNLCNDACEWKPIKGWFKNKSTKLLRITHEYGSFECSHGHKVWTMGGYKNAADIVAGMCLRMVQENIFSDTGLLENKKVLQPVVSVKMDLQSSGNKGKTLGQKQKTARCFGLRILSQIIQQAIKRKDEISILLSLLRCKILHKPAKMEGFSTVAYQKNARCLHGNDSTRHQSSDEIKKSNAKSFHQKESESFSFWKNVFITWRKRKLNKTTNTPCQYAGMANGASNFDFHGANEIQISSVLLQGGHCQCCQKNSGRSRREQSSNTKMEVLRPPKDVGIMFTRVVSVEVVKQGNIDESTGSNEKSNCLYDIEIADNHNYFADNILVSNSTSASYRKVLDWYAQGNPDLHILGVTATPDRADEEALGQVYETVAFDYEITDAIRDGWLVPITQKMVHVEGLDFSACRTTAGDLNGADLARVMEDEKMLHKVVSPAVEIIGNRRTLVFAASVVHAERMAELFNRHRPGMAAWVCGKTDPDERKRILADFAGGRVQVVANCAVLTEGFDNPGVECVIMKQTKSRSLYAQMCGRAMRPADSIAHDLNDHDNPEARRALIEASSKPMCEIIDFFGVSGRHKLVTSADILGGNVSERVRELATIRARTGAPIRMDQALEQAAVEEAEEKRIEEERAAARRARLTAKARFTTRTVNPFDVLQVAPAPDRGWDRGKHLSEKQFALLQKQGIDASNMPFAQAKQLLNELFRRWNQGLCTFGQAKILRKRGMSTNCTRDMATRMIDEIARREGWKQK